MRVRTHVLAVVLALACLMGGAAGAAADHLTARRSAYVAIGDNPWACRGVWLPRYYPGSPDPFAYKYCPRGYYPYYNSGYWQDRALVGKKRAHFRHPKYHPAWGANRRHYRHYPWHAKHHGRHQHHQW